MLKKLKTWTSKAFDFLRESFLELKKVTWPSKKETLNYTIIVILVTTFVAIYLWACDLIFVFLLKKFFLF